MRKRISFCRLCVFIVIMTLISCASNNRHSSQNSQGIQATSEKEIFLAIVITTKIAQVFYEDESSQFINRFTRDHICAGYKFDYSYYEYIINLGFDNEWQNACEGKGLEMFKPCMLDMAGLAAIAKRDNEFPTFSQVQSLARRVAMSNS
ncbi:MAG: hypothetical protein JXB49_01335 [Bacteroidales bacterium]|nr:hypothetical protein [Bacteroidales bacterium]